MAKYGKGNGRARCGLTAAAKLTVAVLFLLAACAVTYCVGKLMSEDGTTSAVAVKRTEKLPVIVIDAGHGGLDSGAVGVDGSLEKEINLDVAKRIFEICRLAGLDSVLTRSEDVMLVDDGVTSHRKMHDLKNRLALAQSADKDKGAVLVSIHMNKFQDPKYSGLQVWYSQNDPSSKELASYIQGYARTWLDPENKRETKCATSAIYILDRAEIPAVLVECGFLSNPDECARLGSDEYRQKLAVTVFAALCKWLERAAE